MDNNERTQNFNDDEKLIIMREKINHIIDVILLMVNLKFPRIIQKNLLFYFNPFLNSCTVKFKFEFFLNFKMEEL